MSESVKPKLWSDFDGTSVELASKTSYRRYTKYPLAINSGYLDFLSGCEEEGAKIAGIVSRRPNILVRRVATRRSINNLGLDKFFNSQNTILTGSEKKKAEFIVNESKNSLIAIVEDKPQNLGKHLINQLLNKSDATKSCIVLGVVNSKKSKQYYREFESWVMANEKLNCVSTNEMVISDQNESFVLRVVMLDPFSKSSGKAFAKFLINS